MAHAKRTGMARLSVIAISAAAAATTACSREVLDPIVKQYSSVLGYVAVDAKFCVSPPVLSRQKIKYLFVLDKSDSNQPAFTVVPGDVNNTDPSGNRRYGPLLQFLTDLPVDPNQTSYFSLVNFNDIAYDAAGGPFSGTVFAPFDPDKAAFEATIRNQWRGSGTMATPQPVDRGYTNYVSALTAVRNAIRNDAQLESGSLVQPPVTSAYRIIFVSDGIPKVPSTAPGGGLYQQAFTTDIEPIINQILSLKDDPTLNRYIGDIVLNTAYYFNDTQVAGAQILLQQMADAGNGQFMMFGAGENILYGAFAPPIRNVRRVLTDVFVENRNAIWWDDGRLMLDVDSDGMPEEIEDRFGSNPRMVDSDGNGVSDLVEYRLKGRPCEGGAGCPAATRNLYSVCDGFSPQTDAAGRVTFGDQDKDGLNDCEEFILKSDRTKFDSNSDFIPDEYAFRASVPFIAGTNGAYAMPAGDGITNYLKLKMGLPVQVDRAKVLDYRTRVTELFRERTTDLTDECFHLKVDPVAFLGPNNILRLYLVENSAVIDDKPSLRVAERVIDLRERVIRFTDGDFR